MIIYNVWWMKEGLETTQRGAGGYYLDLMLLATIIPTAWYRRWHL